MQPMNLFKTTLWSGLAVAIKTFSNLLISKVLALYVGPSGFAVLGQFQNIVQTAQVFSGSMVQQGVIKYTAEFYDEPIEKIKFWQAAFKIIVYSSLLLAVILVSSSHWLAARALHCPNYSYLFIALGLVIFFYVMNNFLLAILNGEKEIKSYSYYSIILSLQGLVLTVILTSVFKLPGALWSLLLNQSLIFLFFYPFLKKKLPIKIKQLWGNVEKIYIKKLLVFGAMSVVSAIALPCTQIAIRTLIIHKLSVEAAGYWQAVTRISDSYLAIITSVLSVYYLPKLSSLKNYVSLKGEILQAYKYILPATILLALLIFLLKKPIVYVLLSKKFLPILPLIGAQLIGDILKIGSWLLGFVMWAKGNIKLFILTEVIFSFTYFLFAWIGIQYFELIGVLSAFCLNYFLYWITIGYFLNRNIKSGLSE
ncbi:MAG: lipopolysaccharide biosynthesis protein [Gammaproteobacteria bacterium]|jgi:PST family polysaccharide transporter|nr:lipopolysaccharide biosynthesis protein [Gammaproteobacteria bacterium]